ncbi:MAG: BrnT family toxin [Rhodoferax sp.]
MDISFDTVKDATNMAKHGVSLGQAAQLEWDTALTWPDTRYTYNERRECAMGYIGLRLFHVVFVDRVEGRRIISLRKANQREINRYAKT